MTVLLEVDPNIVKPGWGALVLTLLLGLAIVGLMISMRRQVRKIEVPHRDELDEQADQAGDDGGSGDADPDDRQHDPTSGRDTGSTHPA